jgi:hypothetical protein
VASPVKDIGITIVSLVSQDSQVAPLPLATREVASVAERTAELAEKHLNALARETRRRQQCLSAAI